MSYDSAALKHNPPSQRPGAERVITIGDYTFRALPDCEINKTHELKNRLEVHATPIGMPTAWTTCPACLAVLPSRKYVRSVRVRDIPATVRGHAIGRTWPLVWVIHRVSHRCTACDYYARTQVPGIADRGMLTQRLVDWLRTTYVPYDPHCSKAELARRVGVSSTTVEFAVGIRARDPIKKAPRDV